METSRMRSDRALLASIIHLIEHCEVHPAVPKPHVGALRLACRVETAHSGLKRSANDVAHGYSATYLRLLRGKAALRAHDLPPLLEMILAGQLLKSRLIIENDRYLDDRQFRMMLLTVHLGVRDTPEGIIQEIERLYADHRSQFTYVASYEIGRRGGDWHLHLLGLFPHSARTPRMRPLFIAIRDYLAHRNGNRPGSPGHINQRGRATPAQLKPIEASYPICKPYGVGGMDRRLAYISKEQPGVLGWDGRQSRSIYVSDDLVEEMRRICREVGLPWTTACRGSCEGRPTSGRRRRRSPSRSGTLPRSSGVQSRRQQLREAV
jgi:hypothetical protein